jgi:hypothetical protein
MEHLAGQRVLPSTEEELHQHNERKAKREANRLRVATKAEAHRQEKIKMKKAAQKANNAAIVQTFANRARESALAAGATTEATEAAATTATSATSDAEMAFVENDMHE